MGRSPQKGTKEHRLHREKNNEAIKKCREKQREKTKLREIRCNSLLEENAILRNQIEILESYLDRAKFGWTN